MSNYRDAVQKIREMRNELNTNYMIMTPYERMRIEAAIEREVNAQRSTVLAGVRQEWNTAIEAHKSAQRALDAAVTHEAQRWQGNAEKLNIELQLARLAFDRSQDVKSAQAEYQRAIESGDTVKQRAFAEVFSGALNKFHGERLDAHRLSVDAADKLEALTVTDEISEAQAKGNAINGRVIDLQQELSAIVHDVGGDSNVDRELNRVEVQSGYDREAGRWSKSVKIRDAAPQTLSLPDQRQTYNRVNSELQSNVRTA
jgi:hypothetical protein